MITTTAQAAKEFGSLRDTFLIAMDENGEEYILDSVAKKCTHYDNPLEYHYAIQLRKTNSNGCIKR